MDSFNFEKCSMRNSIICCELVIKIKQYINILQFESSRLSMLQLECNKLLDKFYSSKEEFDFLIKDSIRIKYIGEEDSLRVEEYIKEFSTFFMNVWQVGKLKFSEKGKRMKYICFVGNPLVEVMSTIQSFVQEVMVRLTYMPYHSECASIMHNICNQIHIELQEECLGSADTCLRQYIYLQAAIPFLQELKYLIHQYLITPGIHTDKQFVDTVILQIPAINKDMLKDDDKDMVTFRFVVDLLNGKLVDKDVLDHNSDIRPIVEDDINLKRSLLVTKTVEWIMQQYKIEDVSSVFHNLTHHLVPVDAIGRKRSCYDWTPYSLRTFNYPNPVDFIDTMDTSDIQKLDWSLVYNGSPSPQRKFSRRGRKTGLNNNEISTSNDLQPIRLQTLQTPLLPPLL
ncbi:uncharacterized protein LOC124356281 isoform X1 [Homalodisca vitripennis]|uniref:uncharacterized protein LOC124356281 isoform X1 n=1 Tax=Homalodisca vitripennis TaxID=197043 RepID=UPI001EEA9B19|nr:uncharacterized protein LOC124356281 isoform X1 [Homalodisca vitripennis]